MVYFQNVLNMILDEKLYNHYGPNRHEIPYVIYERCAYERQERVIVNWNRRKWYALYSFHYSCLRDEYSKVNCPLDGPRSVTTAERAVLGND